MKVMGVRMQAKFALLFAGLLAGMFAPAAWAAEPPAASPPAASPTAQAALQTLLTSQVGRADPSTKEVVVGAAAGSTLAAPAGAGGRAVVPVARGQSLDNLLRHHMASSPLRIEVQRELVRQLNPQAFAPGNGYRLLAGARLQMPTVQDQAQHAFGKVISAADVHAERHAEERGGATAAARKGWVRYP